MIVALDLLFKHMNLSIVYIAAVPISSELQIIIAEQALNLIIIVLVK